MTAIPRHLTTDVPHETCPSCGQQVIVTITADMIRKTLDPTPVTGGMYDPQTVLVHGVATRRPLYDVTMEIRAQTASHGGGLNPHPKHRRR